MNLLSIIKKAVRKTALAGAVTSLALAAGVFAMPPSASALPTSCNDAANEVIWCGASSVSVLQSDYHNGDGHNSATAIQTVYNSSSFGISTADIDAMGSTAVAGTVTKSGNVIVGGNVVATDALTSGRQNMAGSTAHTINGVTFYTRTPSVSFVENSLDAYVVMKGGVFQFAILSSCGNPVSATPKITPTPKYTINKTVAVKGSTSFVKSVSNLTYGTHVIYHITVASTGNTDVTNLNVSDVLPSEIQYQSGTLARDGADYSSHASQFFGSGVDIGSLAAGKATVFSFEAIVQPNNAFASNCTVKTLNNEGKMTATGLPPENSTATITTKCQPPTTPSSPKLPVCTNFDVAASADRTVKVTAFTYQSNGATFDSAVINWGEGANTQVKDTNAVIGQIHQYSADNTYVINVVINFILPNAAKSPYTTPVVAACQRQVTFSTTTPPVVTPPTTPTARLVNTGAGSVVGIFGAAVAIGTLGYRFFLSRRLNGNN